MQSVHLHLLYFLILLSHIAKVLAIPGCLSDRDKDHRPRQNCTAASFSDVQPGFQLTTKVLLFPSNLFSILSWSSFQDFAEIYEIDLTNNTIPNVPPSDAPVLPSLRVLRLGSNRLSSLPDVSFSACPGLIELYLDNNAIDSLTDHTFSGLSQLEILDLSSNRIGVLPLCMLHPLPAIETLLLENNKITVLPDDWFIQKEEVPYLYLSANPWVCSCSHSYLHTYLTEYYDNIYVRDGPTIERNEDSVTCDSPDWLRGYAVVKLEELNLCTTSWTSRPNLVGRATEPLRTLPLTTTSTTSSPPTTSPTTISPTTTSPTTTSPPTTSPTTTFPTTTSLATTSQAQTTSRATFTTPATLEHTEDHRVVTLSWYHTFTRVTVWSHHSGSEVIGDGLQTLVMSTNQVLPAKTSTSATTTTAKPAGITSPAATTSVVTPTPIPSPVTFDPTSGEHHSGTMIGGVGVFCFWLFMGCVLLFMVSGVCTVLMLAGLLYWYRRAYRPIREKLAGRRRGGRGVKLLMSNMQAGEEQHLVGEGSDGVMALYRTVLFISREEREEKEQRDVETGRGGEEGRAFINLEPERDVRDTSVGGETAERGLYRKTLYRVFSREDALEGLKDMMEKGGVISEDGEKRRGSCDGAVSKKRYSVILREEIEEAGQGREEQDWVVGGWEVTRRGGGTGNKGEGPRSSLGEWLADYLPSIPWRLTTPSQDEATQ